MILLGIATFIALILIYDTLRLGISPYPTPRTIREALIVSLPALPQGKIYELGSGWGGLARALARRFPDRMVVAYEAALIPYLFSKSIQWLVPCRNLRIYHRNFLRELLEDAALVCCYLYPGAMRQLSSKFRSELRPGTMIVSHTFALPEYKPLTSHHSAHTPIYIYQISSLR